MEVQQVLLLVLLVLLGGLAVSTDHTSGRVRNKHLVPFLFVAVTVDLVWVLSVEPPVRLLYPIFSAALVVAVAIGLYSAGLWPAGDAKLFMVMILLAYPLVRNDARIFWPVEVMAWAFLGALVYQSSILASRLRLVPKSGGRDGALSLPRPSRRPGIGATLGRYVVFTATTLTVLTLSRALLPPALASSNRYSLQFSAALVALCVIRRVTVPTFVAPLLCAAGMIALLLGPASPPRGSLVRMCLFFGLALVLKFAHSVLGRYLACPAAEPVDGAGVLRRLPFAAFIVGAVLLEVVFRGELFS